MENGKVIMQRDVLDMLCDLDGIDDFDINRFKESKNYGICAPRNFILELNIYIIVYIILYIIF